MLSADVEAAAHPFFQDMPPSLVERLAAHATSLGVAAGQHVFREGDPADRFFLITQGRVALETFAPGRGPVPIATIHAGDALGWSWLFPPYRWHFDATAVEPVSLLVFAADRLRDLFAADHDLGYSVLYRVAGIMVQRLQSTRLQLLDVYGAQLGPRGRSG